MKNRSNDERHRLCILNTFKIKKKIHATNLGRKENGVIVNAEVISLPV